ncbi:MAG: helix-turn-helix domain-containing protein [Hyphomicrobiaceae bacterium]
MFAERLRKLRRTAGFRSARAFAKELGIAENRYTRYERAEVEPNLQLLATICERLRISPDLLLGFDEQQPWSQPQGHPLVLREAGASLHQTYSATTAHSKHARSPQPATPTSAERTEAPASERDATIWHLALAVARLRHGQAAIDGPSAAPLSYAELGLAGELFDQIEDNPFRFIAELTRSKALAEADPAVRDIIAQRIASVVSRAT